MKPGTNRHLGHLTNQRLNEPQQQALQLSSGVKFLFEQRTLTNEAFQHFLNDAAIRDCVLAHR